MTWFVPSAAPADLAGVVACRYTATAAGRHDLFPDGCVDLVWAAGLGPTLCGPDTHAWSFDLGVGLPIAGVRFLPGAAPAAFGAPASALVDRQVALADLLGSRTARLLDERLAEAEGAGGRVEALDAFLRRRLTDRADAAIIAVARRLSDEPRRRLDRLADDAGLSVRQLRRRFQLAVGYGPGFFARVARLQRFAVGALRHGDQGRSLAELAAAAGYADQSHLAKDVRDIAGRTPRELVTALARSSVDARPADGRSVQDEPARGRSRWSA